MAMLTDPGAATTFPQLVRAAAAAYGDDVAITLKETTTADKSITFLELDRQSAELAKGLIARGVGKGMRVGFIYGNNPSFALMLAAISRIGAIAVPISTMIKSNELVRVLRQSDVSGLIVQRKLLGKDYVDRVCDALPELRERDTPDLTDLADALPALDRFQRRCAAAERLRPAPTPGRGPYDERRDAVANRIRGPPG